MKSLSWNFEVFSTQNESGQKWKSIICSIPEHLKDVYFLLEYAQVYEREFQEPAYLFTYGDNENLVLMVGVKRSINNLSFYSSTTVKSETLYYDLSTLYGYGGPLIIANCTSIKPDLFQEFRAHLNKYCLENNIVSEFLRLHPKIGNYELFIGDNGLVKKNHTIWIDLSKSESEILMSMRNDPRRSIKIAQENNVQIVKSDLSNSDIKEFHRLYTTTMKRLGALPMYFFTVDYFLDLIENLKNNVSIFFAKWDDKYISSYMYVHEGDFIDLYLGGSDPQYWNLKANPFCLYSAAIWAKSQDFSYYHMGGGHGAELDSLLHFKSQFSNNIAPFYMYRHIHNIPMYNELCDLKDSFNSQNSDTQEKASFTDAVLKDYFPEYRA